uniref:Uncharacterized protein n=1 Tax=Amphimedon queenslandica TaxID=400682 RepID=A0A1X7SXZ8_AMPQE
MNNECLAEEIKLADGEEQELRTLLNYKEVQLMLSRSVQMLRDNLVENKILKAKATENIQLLQEKVSLKEEVESLKKALDKKNKMLTARIAEIESFKRLSGESKQEIEMLLEKISKISEEQNDKDESLKAATREKEITNSKLDEMSQLLEKERKESITKKEAMSLKEELDAKSKMLNASMTESDRFKRKAGLKVPDLDALRHTYDQAVTTACDAMNEIPSDDLKEFLYRDYPYFIHQLEHIDATYNILAVVRKRCSIINVSLLEDVAINFTVEKAITIIKEYKKHMHKFKSLRMFLNVELYSDTLFQCDKISFVVARDVDNCTLDDAQVLLNTVLCKELAPHVMIKEFECIKDHASFTIICSIPLQFFASLKEKVNVEGKEF